MSDGIFNNFKGKIPRGTSCIKTNLSGGIEFAEEESTANTKFTVAYILTRAHGLFQPVQLGMEVRVCL